MKPIAWALLPLLAVASLAHAAIVDVRVSNNAGRPLAGAVVMLEPASGKLPVIVGAGDMEHELRLNVAEEAP